MNSPWFKLPERIVNDSNDTPTLGAPFAQLVEYESIINDAQNAFAASFFVFPPRFASLVYRNNGMIYTFNHKIVSTKIAFFDTICEME